MMNVIFNFFNFFNSFCMSMFKPLDYDKFALHTYSRLVCCPLIFPFLHSLVTLKFAAFGVYHPEFYPYLPLNH